MKKTIASILGIIILATIGITVEAQTVPRPLPQVIQNLSDEDYAIWAQWQNQQASRRAEEIEDDTGWLRYNYADRVTSSSYSRGSATTRMSGTTNATNNSSSRSGKGWSSRSGSRSATRRGSASTNTNRFGGTTVTSHKVRYLNPDYIGSGTVTAYNPWVRFTGGLGAPDWGVIFVPCKKGTVTMQEVLDRLVGPQNPERVFRLMMGDYFGN